MNTGDMNTGTRTLGLAVLWGRALISLDGEPFSAFFAAALQYEAPAFGAHTLAKPVIPRSLQIAGLECSFHDKVTLVLSCVLVIDIQTANLSQEPRTVKRIIINKLSTACG